MTWGLIEKELRQHAIALAFLLGILASGLALLSANRMLSSLSGTPLEALHLLLITLAPLVSLFLAQLLVAGEFRQKTQLFLEGLPLPRWRMLAVKYSLGLAVIMLGVAAALATSLLRSRHSDAMTPHFALILASKSLAWTWFIYSALFAQGFLGRYRLAFGVLAITILLELSKSGLPVSKFCAFQLVDARFGYERVLFPVASLIETAIGIAGFTALGFWLGLMRDSTVASLLAERMSSREKTFFTFMSIAAIMAIGIVAERETSSAPVRLPGAYEVDRGPAHVAASAAVDFPLSKENEAARRVATDMAGELERLSRYLGCATMPPVFIIHRRDLSGKEFENGELKRRQGLMVRANLTAADFDEDALLQWIVRESLLLKSGGRAGYERNAWVLDGFPLWWSQMRGKQSPPEQHTPELDLASGAMPSDFSARSLRDWLSLEKASGKEKTRALAWTGLAILSTKHGPDACQRFLGEMLGREVPQDARGWLRDVMHPMPSRFLKSTGLPLEAFAVEWRAALEKDGRAASR